MNDFRVVYTDQFLENISDHIAYLRSEGVADRTIEQWYERLFKRLSDLEAWPRMFPIEERYSAQVGRTMRKANFGDYLVFYEVKEEAREVRITAFYHGATRS